MPVIEANIATILSEYRVAINAGANDGIVVGAPVTVWRHVIVKDPVTDEVLGHVDLDALVMQIISVQDRLSVAEIPRATSNLLNFSFTVPRKRIRTDEPGEDDRSVRVNTGDRVTIEVPEEEQAGDE